MIECQPCNACHRFETHDTDPSSGVSLGEGKQLAPNVALRKLIVGWQEGEAKRSPR